VVDSTLDVAAVYREHFDYVLTNLRRLGVPVTALEDACHDVFVVVHRRARSYDHRCAMRTWLYGVVRRVAADVRRNGTRHRRRLDAVRMIASPSAVLEDTIADRRLVQEFLDALDEGKREVFILVELEEMTANEVAATLHINPNTAAARLRAARRVFAERLAAQGNAQHELRLLAAARTPEHAPSETRARVWAGLAPLVVPAAKASVLVGLGWAAAIVVATTAIVGATSPPPPAPVALHRIEIETPPPVQPIAAAVVAPPTIVAPPPIVEPPTIAAPPPPVLVPATAAPAPRTVARPAAARTEPAPTTRTPSDAELRAETELAGRVLRETDPAKILALVDEYRRTFAHGFYADRLSARRIEALCRTGKPALAQAEHAALAKRQPALAKRALAKCDANHEDAKPRPSSG
jgi:RNA polymerase sigma-70 factor, ECF subfamily